MPTMYDNRVSKKPLLFCVSVLTKLFIFSSSNAQFTTIINIPPDPPPSSVSSDTQINIFGGGTIGSSFHVGSSDGSVFNVEFNVFGGIVERVLRVFAGSTVNVSGGTVENVFAEGGDVNVSGGTLLGTLKVTDGAHVNIFGGNVASGLGDLDVFDGEVNLSGGIVGEGFIVRDNVVANITGGRFHQRFTQHGGTVNIFGGEFRLDGQLVTGLNTIGDSKVIDVPQGSVLSGTLVDGSTFAIASSPNYVSDTIAGGQLTLHAAATPPLGPSTINVPSSPAPGGVRGGQTLNVNVGGTIGDAFNVAPGGVLNVMGGNIGHYLEVVNGAVNLNSGTIGSLAALTNSQVHVSGGAVGFLELVNESLAVINGGSVGNVRVYDSEIEVLGGSLNDGIFISESGIATFRGGVAERGTSIHDGGTINIFGGVFNGVQVEEGALANILGGEYLGAFRALAGGNVLIVGSQFAIDNVPIEGLFPGEPFVVTSTDANLTGILQDGAPFQFRLQRQCERGCSIGGIDPGATLMISLPAIPEPSTFAHALMALAITLSHGRRV